jgi:hypothetical protein
MLRVASLSASAYGAPVAGQRLDPLYLFARLLIEGGVAEVDVPVHARVRVVLLFSGWVRWCARLLCGHRVHSLWSVPRAGASRAGAALRRVQYLSYANLRGADLSDADLSGVGGPNNPTSALSLTEMPNPGALMSHEELEQKQAATLKGVTFPSGYKYEDQLPGGQTYGDWLAEQKARAKDGENSGPS